MSSSLDLPFMPLYVGDRLAEMATWTGDAQGLYLQLVLLAWAGGPLPADENELALLTRRNTKSFKSSWNIIRDRFAVLGDSWLVLPWLEELRDATAERRESARKHASTAARAKWSKERERKAKEVPQAMPEHVPEHMPEQCPSIESDDARAVPEHMPGVCHPKPKQNLGKKNAYEGGKVVALGTISGGELDG